MVARPGRNFVECAVCGRKGYVSLENGNLKYTWPEDPQNRLTMMGKYEHIREIERHGMGKPENYDELVREKGRKYKEWNDCVQTPPSKISASKYGGEM
jgi:hypothetical protein